MIQIWKNGQKPPYMDSTEPHDLNADKARHAAKSLSYEGLLIAAAGYFLAMNAVGQTPKEIGGMLDLSVADEKAGIRTPLRIPAEANNDDGGDAA
jgi:hypothetical protein